ncbi:MAG TPA: Ku protein [Limnochordia bacterium]|nr:Ku protein [Limnochordia bacterium]
MRSMWKGSLSFGLVNIPVRMYAATQERDIRFNQLHSLCHTPIKYEKVCPRCQRAVEQSEIVRGYQYERGRYVLFTEEELEHFAAQASHTIDILRFVELREVDPIYYDKTYYLEPADTGAKAYALLQEALARSGKIAVAKITMRSKVSLAVVRTYQSLLALETIFYPDEIRDHTQLARPSAAVEERELNMALSLIASLTEPFEPAQYQDERRLGLQELIEAKIRGREVVLVEPTEEALPTLDLLAALQASLQAQQGKGGEVRH